MSSAIDISKPTAGTPTTQSVRDNFAAAKSEIEQLQNDISAKQPADTTLTALAVLDSAAGLIVQTGADAFAKRTLTAGSAVSIANGTGASGNPTVAVEITGLTADASPDAAADYVLTYDASAGVNKKVLLNKLPSSGGDMVGANNLAVGAGGVANAATAFGNIKQAATASVTGVVLKDDITVQTFTSGSGTYTTPANCKWIKTRLVGGGGGGGGSGSGGGYTTGGNGGNTTFGSLTGSGGTGGATSSTGTGASGGSASGGVIFNVAGGSGGSAIGGNIAMGGHGGGSFLGGAAGSSGANSLTGKDAATNSGSGGGGGGGNGSSFVGGGGGGAGGYVEHVIIAPSSTYSYAVGAAGSAGSVGTSGSAGGAGGAGYIVVEEHYN